ncbi:CtsR family transcriptional regulator [Alicyclobacillus curvatus]|nr:CtsR family transcriptional regulator [Alicyclobacillus curvatus]
MARNISDVIERYLKRILEQEEGLIELQRSELAELFQCVPSQINYVIATRFSLDHGYLVESKRGGGGYIRIRKVELEENQPLLTVARAISDQLSQREAEVVIERLLDEGLLTHREAALLKVATSRDVLLVDLPLRDHLRAKILTQCLIALSVTE